MVWGVLSSFHTHTNGRAKPGKDSVSVTKSGLTHYLQLREEKMKIEM